MKKIITLKLDEKQIKLLKDALLTLEITKDLFGNEEYQNLISQIYEGVRE